MRGLDHHARRLRRLGGGIGRLGLAVDLEQETAGFGAFALGKTIVGLGWGRLAGFAQLDDSRYHWVLPDWL
jgi:hypothetical protein